MLTTAVGHYPRIGDAPEQQRLRRAIQSHQAQKLSDAELRAVQDDVTAEILDEQARAGLDWVTDGQIRWDDGQTYLTQRLAGFERGGMIRYFDTNTYYRQPVAVGRVSYGIYLWHFPVFWAVGRWGRSWPDIVRLSVAFSLTALFTVLSWYLLEKPIMRWGRNRLEPRAPVADATIA